MRLATESLKKQIKAMRVRLEPEKPEPWPPEEGSLEWAMLESMKARGIEIPEKPADETGFMFLAGLGAPRIWANYRGEC